MLTKKNLGVILIKKNNVTIGILTDGDLKRLNDLIMASNYLTSFPNNFNGLDSLINLDLQDNSFTILPNRIISLNNLQILNMEDNQLLTIPENINTMNENNLKKFLTPELCEEAGIIVNNIAENIFSYKLNLL